MTEDFVSAMARIACRAYERGSEVWLVFYTFNQDTQAWVGTWNQIRVTAVEEDDNAR